MGFEGAVVIREVACQYLEVRWTQGVVVQGRERVAAEVVVGHLLVGSSTKSVSALHRDPISYFESPLVVISGQAAMLHRSISARDGYPIAVTIPASPSAALVIGLAIDMLATDGSAGGFETSSPPVRKPPTAAPTSLPGTDDATGELMTLESGGKEGDRGVSDAGVMLECVVAGVGCCCDGGTGTGSAEGATDAGAGAGVDADAAVVGVVVDADVVDVPIAAAAAYRNGGNVGGRDDPLLTAFAIDVVEKFGVGIGGFGAAGAVVCRESGLSVT